MWAHKKSAPLYPRNGCKAMSEEEREKTESVLTMATMVIMVTTFLLSSISHLFCSFFKWQSPMSECPMSVLRVGVFSVCPQSQCWIVTPQCYIMSMPTLQGGTGGKSRSCFITPYFVFHQGDSWADTLNSCIIHSGMQIRRSSFRLITEFKKTKQYGFNGIFPTSCYECRELCLSV